MLVVALEMASIDVVVLVVLEEELTVDVTDVELVVVKEVATIFVVVLVVLEEELTVEVVDVELVVAKEVANFEDVVTSLVAVFWYGNAVPGMLVGEIFFNWGVNTHGALAKGPHCFV
jgi:hypothetical protein